jgi:hypothetical protein
MIGGWAFERVGHNAHRVPPGWKRSVSSASDQTGTIGLSVRQEPRLKRRYRPGFDSGPEALRQKRKSQDRMKSQTLARPAGRGPMLIACLFRYPYSDVGGGSTRTVRSPSSADSNFQSSAMARARPTQSAMVLGLSQSSEENW